MSARASLAGGDARSYFQSWNRIPHPACGGAICTHGLCSLCKYKHQKQGFAAVCKKTFGRQRVQFHGVAGNTRVRQSLCEWALD